MLKLTDFIFNGSILSMTVFIEENKETAYHMSVDTNTEYFSVIKSDIPYEYKIYERQAKTALRKYKGKELPEEIASSWC